MRHIDEKINSGNFIDKCTNNSLSDESCVMGIITLIITFFPLLFNVYAFVKMTMFYKKLNFENSIILASAIEIFILEFALTTSLDVFLQFFFFIQIILISFLIKKFANLIKDMQSLFKNNFFFISLNVVNFIIFITYLVFMIVVEDSNFIINLVYKIFYFITTCVLSYSCIFMNRLIAKHKKEYIENYNSFFDPSLLNISSKDLSDIGSITEAENKDNNTPNSNENKDVGSKVTDADSEREGEEFYRIKRKQNKCLYIINLGCSLLELTFTILRFTLLKEDFLDHKYKIVPLTISSEIIYYVYLLICLINISVIFFCFYYYIRRQYSRDTKVYKKRLSKKLFDDAFIEQQKKEDDITEKNEGILTDKKKVRKKSSIDQFNDIVIRKDFDKK